MAYYITGDCHGKFQKIETFCRFHNTSKNDYMIILGDAGINFYLNKTDKKQKKKLSDLPIKFFMIHGNHEERPYNIATYKEREWHGGIVYYEEEYPDLLFAKDGEIYDLDGKKCIAIGGAYSVDKDYRRTKGLPWFESEQPSPEIKKYVEEQLQRCNWTIDYVFSHTCPSFMMPTDLFLDFIDQKGVDQSTEEWLSCIHKKMKFKKWYFAHYHENRSSISFDMLYEVIKELGSDDFIQKLGRPVYKYGDLVCFYFNNGRENTEKCGKIDTIDEYGTVEQAKEVSYDIYDDAGILYKHIPESHIIST